MRLPDAFGIGFLLGLIFGIGVLVGIIQVRHEAIAHHAAHYAITNEATGATEFQWNQEK